MRGQREGLGQRGDDELLLARRCGWVWRGQDQRLAGRGGKCGAFEPRLLVATMARGLWPAGSGRDAVPTELRLLYCAEIWAKGLEMAGSGRKAGY